LPGDPSSFFGPKNMLICTEGLTVTPILNPEKELDGEKAMALMKREASRIVRKDFIVNDGCNELIWKALAE
jgi:hypothetical protein